MTRWRSLAMALVVASPAVVWASGTYVGRLPVHPGRPDPVRYHLGRKLFNGEMTPRGPGAAATQQAPELRTLQARLPQGAATFDLDTLAGRLSDDELDALEYFVSIRFKVE